MPTFSPTGHISGTVNQPFKTVGGRNLHLIVNAFKNQVGDNAFKGSLFRLYQIDVFRTDNHVYRLVYAETTVHTGKFCAEISTSSSWSIRPSTIVALADKIGYEGIFRLVVYLLRRAHLLDVALVHYDNRIGHGEGLFLIMGDINKCDSQLIFQPDQFVLHVLAQLEIQGSQRLVQKQDLGSLTMARAMAIRCCCPPLRESTERFSKPSRFTSFNAYLILSSM